MKLRISIISFWVASTITLICLFVVFRYMANYCESQARQNLYTDICISSSDDTSIIIHPVKTDNGIFVIIPSHWNLQKLQMKYQGRFFHKLYYDGKEVSSHWMSITANRDSSMDLKLLSFWNKLSIEESLQYNQSELNTIFINTKSGSMSKIDCSEDKSVSESGTIIAVSNRGKIEYQGFLESIHGRGNMTWKLSKKPYSIKLKKKTPLFGLKKSKKFNLLANACDESSLRNWIMFETAQRLQLPYAVRAEFVTLYLNGYYHGLYQLTNKVELSKESIDIEDLEKATQLCNQEKLSSYPRFCTSRNDTMGFIKGIDQAMNPEDISGGYLLETKFKLRHYEKSSSGFIPKYGYPIEIKSPEFATREEVLYISKYYEEMLEAIRSNDGYNNVTGRHYSDYIDEDSFIYYYLCSELLYNYDAVFSSFYMYKDKGKKIHCGPLWDYDLSLNSKMCFVRANGHNSFYVRTAREKDGSLMLFGQLYKHKEFRERLIQKYNTKVYPIVSDFYKRGVLDSIHIKISKDIQLNNLLWKSNFSFLNDVVKENCCWNERAEREYATINSLSDYWNVCTFLEKRSEWLAEVWSNNAKEYQMKHINWDFGLVEDFQYISTQIQYVLPKDESFTWPRFFTQNVNHRLIAVTDSMGNNVGSSDTLRDYRLLYEAIR